MVRIYGLFTIDTNVFGKVDIIIMENTLKNRHKTHPLITFDLKGSLIHRNVKFSGKEKKWWLNG